MKITTNVDFRLVKEIKEKKKEKFGNDYFILVWNTVNAALKTHSGKEISYKRLMLLVAEDTKSVLSHCDEIKMEFCFEYVGV